MKHTLQTLALGTALLAAPGPTALASSNGLDSNAGFDVIVLGAGGGIQDGNLSSYLIKAHGDTHFVACDAGTLVNGILAAEKRGTFVRASVPKDSDASLPGYILKEKVSGYLISHPHFDHIAGLVIASPDDSSKNLYALPSVIDALSHDVFNWKTWPNFGDRGERPLNKYNYQPLPVNESVPLAGTRLSVRAFPLSHGGVESTAFLLQAEHDSILYFGDTGPDALEHGTRMHEVWSAAAERIQKHQLTGIIIEASFPNSKPDAALFGHMNPKWLLRSLHDLEQMAGGAGSLKGLTVLVAHVKYSLANGPQPQQEILRELEKGNDTGVKFVMAEQGALARFTAPGATK